MFLRIRSAVLLELILPALATSPVEEDVGSTRGWGWGSASRLLITRRVGDGSSYKLHDSKPRPSRPMSRRQQLLYRREEKPSQGQMASDATFQAGAVGAGPVCTGKGLHVPHGPQNQCGSVSGQQAVAAVCLGFLWAFATGFQFWSCHSLSVSSRGVQRHRDKPNSDFPHNPVKATRSTVFPGYPLR